MRNEAVLEAGEGTDVKTNGVEEAVERLAELTRRSRRPARPRRPATASSPALGIFSGTQGGPDVGLLRGLGHWNGEGGHTLASKRRRRDV